MLDRLARGWAVVTGASLVRMALGLVASVLVARQLGPVDFGRYTVLAAMVGIIGALAEGGLTEAAVQRIAAVWPAQPDVARDRSHRFFWLRLAVAAAIVAVGWATADLLAALLLAPGDADLIRWALLGTLATAGSSALSAILQARGAFGRMSAITLTNAALTAVLAVALTAGGALNLLSALIVLGLGTSLACVVVGLLLLPADWRPRLRSLQELKDELGPLVRTGRWLGLANLFAMLSVNLDVLLLTRWAPLPVVGTYALALNLASKADVVNHSLYTVLLPAASGLGGAGAVGRYVRQALRRSGLIALCLLPLIPLAEPLVVLVYGTAYAPAADLFRLLLGVVIFDVMATPILLLALSFRRPGALAAAEATRAGTLALAGVALIPAFGAGGAVVARLLSRCAGAAVVLVALRRYLFCTSST